MFDNTIEKFVGSHAATISEKNVSYFLYEFAKSYLYACYVKKVSTKNLEVIRVVGRFDYPGSAPQLPSIADDYGENAFRITNPFFEATVRFNSALYEINFNTIRIDDRTFFPITVLGLESHSKESHYLLYKVCKEAMKFSSYNKAFLEVIEATPASADRNGIYVRKIEVPKDNINEVYLPENILNHISLFIQSVLKYATVKKPLRYLFAGQPGTAKTKIIRAIANACKGKATFIFTNGNERRIESLFEFVDLFSPVVLCIDDIDLMTGSRNEGLYTKELAELLQKLDGFINRDFFLLATTNEKRLVDLAASRPGRFDMILDIGLIQPEQYLALIRNKTDNPKIIALFNEEVFRLFQYRKVTGAFIANLVKHLELIASFDRQKLNSEYLIQTIKESYYGFYKEPESLTEKIGFGG